jgi:hypothetical protein
MVLMEEIAKIGKCGYVVEYNIISSNFFKKFAN